MNDNASVYTIQEFFKNTQPIRIPDYQRSYNWENMQCRRFLDDLLEQVRIERDFYYFGQMLFEEDNGRLFVVDGQQRLTTTLLFISSVIKILNSRKSNPKDFASRNLYNLKETKEIYLSGVFNTIDNDQSILNKIIRKQVDSKWLCSKSSSQQRIIQAYSFFNHELSKLESMILYGLLWTLEHATKINTLLLYNKNQAAQIFSYQNHRGNDCFRYYILKAFQVKQTNEQKPYSGHMFSFEISLS